MKALPTAPLKLMVQVAVVLAVAMLSSTIAGAAPRSKTNQIAIAYMKPANPAHEALYALLVKARVLEKVQEILSPFRLPSKLTIMLVGCGGLSNAWYEEAMIRVCYEFVDEIWSKAPTETTLAGVTPIDATLGPLAHVFFHEFGHAVLDLHQIPVLGRDEDAADAVSAILLLSIAKTEARRKIWGAAYMFKDDLKRDVALNLFAFSEVHGTSQQRFFNLLCIAYGADQQMFADLVDKGYLPKECAEECADEARLAIYAFNRQIGPHIDKTLAKQVLGKQWMPDVNRRPPPGPK